MLNYNKNFNSHNILYYYVDTKISCTTFLLQKDEHIPTIRLRIAKIVSSLLSQMTSLRLHRSQSLIPSVNNNLIKIQFNKKIQTIF